ncbi:MAG: transposase, partial [Verrucomicrobiota bacterium]
VDGVLRVALRRITKWYRKATGRALGKSGAVTSVQRFGSALNLNVHFHIIHLDGVYDPGADGSLRFFQATPTNEDIDALAVDIATACERWLSLRGFSGVAEDTDPDAGEVDAQAVLQLASLMGVSATGPRAGKTARRTQRLGGRNIPLGPRCAAYEGYNIHANVAFDASDRGGLEVSTHQTPSARGSVVA